MRHHRAQFRYAPGRSGVTLIEITITLLLIGIMAAVASPKIMSAFSHYRLESASAQLAADLKMAREYAKTAGKNQAVSFDVGQNSYSMSGLPDRDHPSIDYTADLDDLSGVIAITSVDFSAATTVTFDMYGHPDSGGTIELQTGSLSKTITVEGSTGKVTLP